MSSNLRKPRRKRKYNKTRKTKNNTRTSKKRRTKTGKKTLSKKLKNKLYSMARGVEPILISIESENGTTKLDYDPKEELYTQVRRKLDMGWDGKLHFGNIPISENFEEQQHILEDLAHDAVVKLVGDTQKPCSKCYVDWLVYKKNWTPPPPDPGYSEGLSRVPSQYIPDSWDTWKRKRGDPCIDCPSEEVMARAINISLSKKRTGLRFHEPSETCTGCLIAGGRKPRTKQRTKSRTKPRTKRRIK